MEVEVHHSVHFGSGTLRVCDGSRYGQILEKKHKPTHSKVLICIHNPEGTKKWVKRRKR